MTLTSSDPTVHSAYRYGALALLLAAGAIAIALGYQHLGGLEPCELCLKQRYAYYAGVPLLFLALVSLSAGQTRVAALLFGLVALGFLGNAGLGVYHAGVEWKFWEGPTACSGAQQITANAGNMLDALKQTNVVRCDDAAWRFIGLSFAGWNVLASLFIAFLGARAASETVHPR
ncbi:disulfide bond formation protein B [Hyphomicrobium sp. xq]|uniref:Disulfide bond formation protein B n=1 Tax=Hyphomicrobium album TaxID=2665159 RepID=A0A6I3KJ40_9HYPH|nr:disulfide bond formation protein B [Hyphomicrobium album]MTD95074.1 disulfide bond formation protein B [Hyphomicrobium album]